MKSFTQLLDWYIEKLPQMTKEEADFIEEICKWRDEERSAFVMAKRIFEDKEER